MEETDLFAFYGSLRRGMSNYWAYKDKLEFVSTQRIVGYELYTLGDYPYAVYTEDPKAVLVTEIFSVKNQQTKQSIHEMEIDAGYTFDLIDVEGNRVGIYLFDKAGGDPKVDSGDWVQFYGK